MAKILLGATGSVAALKVPELVTELAVAGHELKLAVTESALYFFDPADVPMIGRGAPPIHRDRDEWPNRRYQRGDPVLHINLRNWADLLIVAPLDANTLAKFAHGLCDNLLTCVFRAWDFAAKPIILAPAMNTLMWENPATLAHLRSLLATYGDQLASSGDWPLERATEMFARHAPRLILAPPQAKTLACGDVGVGAMADVAHLAELARQVAKSIDSFE